MIAVKICVSLRNYIQAIIFFQIGTDMPEVLDVLHDTSLLVDLTISLVGLSFVCALTYSMRWLSGKASECLEAINEQIAFPCEIQKTPAPNRAEAGLAYFAESKSEEPLAVD